MKRLRELIASGVPEKACFLGCSAMLLTRKMLLMLLD